MKIIKILLISLLLLSCSTDSLDECECTKTTYEYVQGVTTGSNGLPQMYYYKDVINIEQVDCRDEIAEQNTGNGLFYNVECN